MVTKMEGAGGGMEWEIGFSRCTLLSIEWINNKVLNHNRKEYKKECICMYNRITLLYSRNEHNFVNQLYFN